MIATLIGMSLIAQVASSWLVIWKQPSPSIAQTVDVGHADLGAHGRRHREAHGAEATGVEPRVGLLVADEVGGPHLVLADARGEDRLGTGDRAEPLDDVLRGQRAVGGRVVAERVLLLQPGEEGDPRLVVTVGALGLQQRDELGDDLAAVADDRHVGVAVLADLGRVDVGVDDQRVGCEGVEVAGHAVVEARAEADDEVALLQAGDRGHRAVHAGHAEVLRVAVGEGAARHQRGDDRDAGQGGQLRQLARRAGADHAAADVEHRTPRLADQPHGLLDLLGVGRGDGPVARQLQLGRPRERRLRLQCRLGHVDQHRPGATGRGDVEGLGDRARDVGRVGDEEVVLGDRHRDAADVGLLEGVGADHRGADLAGDGHHRHRVHVRVGQRRHQVGRARPRGRHADADAPGRRGVPLRGVPGTLLVADQDVPDPRGVHQGVVRREDRAAGDAEDVGHAGRLQGRHEALRSRDRSAALSALLRHGSSSVVFGPTKNPSARWATRGDACACGLGPQLTRRVRTRISVRMRQPSSPGASGVKQV